MLLEGKRALVFGVLNEYSIAWGIAKALHDHGATVGFSSHETTIKRVRPLAEQIGSTFVEACDVTDDGQIDTVFDRWQHDYPSLDILVHSIANAKREELEGEFVNTSREGFRHALDISAYSLVAITKAARKLMAAGASITTLTYYGGERVIPNYNVMGVAKSALEACVRYLAADLGPDGIRVNAISAGPVRTMAAMGVSGFRGMYREFPALAPLRSNITIDDVGNAAVYLSSDLASQVTGQVMFVDGGFHVLGIATDASS